MQRNSIAYCQLLILYLHACWSIASPSSSSSSQSAPSPLSRPKQTFTVNINCTRDLFNIKLDVGKPFKGVVFAKDFLEECRTRGNRSTSIELNLPTSGCGVRNEPNVDGSMQLSVRIVVQMDEKLRQKADVEKTVTCNLPDQMMEMDISTKDGKKVFRHGRMQYANNDQTESGSNIRRIRVWLELGGPDGSGSVEVGQATTLGIKAVLPGSIGVRIVDCAALDGLGELSQKLLDERGCPVDEQVMPALLSRLRPAEEGWSKPHIDDLVEKLFSATFPAFKFPDRERLHVSCGVQLCKTQCPKVNCSSNDVFLLSADQQLARIEVFNSLAVTAPQIEIDRLQNDRRYNVTINEYSARIRGTQSDGTLCLSTSKLALAFCILGMIFLIAIIVAICCLIWGKSRSSRYAHANNSLRGANVSVFSSGSSSQSRFGSKLLIPYAGSMPYGRVY